MIYRAWIKNGVITSIEVCDTSGEGFECQSIKDYISYMSPDCLTKV